MVWLLWATTSRKQTPSLCILGGHLQEVWLYDDIFLWIRITLDCAKDGFKLLVKSVWETAPKTLLWVSTCVNQDLSTCHD